MGSCLSYSYDNKKESESQRSTGAKVVTLKGDLVEYQVPVFVSQVLQADAAPSSFLCNSDCLLFDDFIPALDLDDELQANQIYFVLPTFKLQFKLSASDMAALAVKASVAIAKKGSKTNNNNNNNRRKRARISPAVLLLPPLNNQSVLLAIEETPTKAHKASLHPKHKPLSGISTSPSVKRLQRYTSRRAKLAARSFRLRLGTIYEGTAV